MGRPVEKGEAIFVRDFIDIAALKFDGVDFPTDAGVICVFSAGWRKALFFDLAPLGEERIPRDYDISKTLGSLMAYLHSQGVFKMTPDDWEYMIGNQWFPFVTLNPDLRLKLVRFARGRRNLDVILDEAKVAVTEALPKMLERWRTSDILQPHIELIEHAVARFHAGDYISAASVIYPRVEGVMTSPCLE